MINCITNPDKNEGAYDLFLSYLNFLIANSDMLLEMIFNRQILEYSRISYKENEYKELIEKTYRKISQETKRPAALFKDGIFPYSPEETLKKDLYEQFIKMGLSKKDAEEKAKDGATAVDILANIKTPQSDFALSEEFLRITKEYFEIFDDFRFEYSQYMKELNTNNKSQTETETP